jgi:preprotein translocase subunit SecG
MSIFVTIIYVFVCLFLILVVLLQAGRGGGMGIAFGGSSQTVFGSRGASTFLSKVTAGFATTFMLLSLFLAWQSSQQDSARLKRLSDEQSRKKAAVLEQKRLERDKAALQAAKAKAPVEPTASELPAGVELKGAAPAAAPPKAGDSDDKAAKAPTPSATNVPAKGAPPVPTAPAADKPASATP